MTLTQPLHLFGALALACAVLIALPAAAQSGTALPPIEKFFSRPQLDDAQLSPGGRFLAALSGSSDGRDILVVVDLQANTSKLAAGYANVDVLDFQWISDERLIFNVSDKQVGPGGMVLANGLYAVNRDGSGLRQLAARKGDHRATTVESSITSRVLPWHTFMLDQLGAQNSEWVYVESRRYNDRGELYTVDLLRLNTLTGHSQTVMRPAQVDSWMLDHTGEPRLAVGSQDGTTKIWYRDPASGQWRSIAVFATYSAGDAAFTPVGFGSDGTLYVRTTAGQDTAALHTFDLAKGKINPEPVVKATGYDFTGSLISGRGKLLGVSLLTDARAHIWFDPDMQALQRKVDAALPGTVNLVTVAARTEAPWALVRAYSDRQPLAWMLYDLQSGKLSMVGQTRPGIDPARMGRQDPIRYKARDGREIPGLLTLPPGGRGKLPMVVLVHGGPYVRGAAWGWNAESQFLASRGYAVLQPEFRGSTGFGRAHFLAGMKQWGLAMQDDIADGVRWAVEQGYADPSRVCIAGASYGGYATLMGLARHSELYQCGINWLGVTDITLLYGHWTFESDLGREWKKYGMPVLIGDKVKDAAQLKATSPIEQAARITKPLLMAYGGVDRRVPIAHGKRFRDAVTQSNKQVEWVEYSNEGHGWSVPENRIDFWGRVEKFLDKHIGQGAAK